MALVKLILLTEREPYNELFTRFDNALFQYVHDNQFNHPAIQDHPRYEEIKKLNLSDDGTNILYLIWMVRHNEYGIYDTFSKLKSQYNNGKKEMDYYDNAIRIIDQFHSHFEDLELYQCTNSGKQNINSRNKKKNDIKVHLL